MVAESNRLPRIVLHQGLTHIKPQLIMYPRALKLRHRETRRAALEPDYLVTRGGQLFRENAAHHTNTDDHYIHFFQTLCHSDSLSRRLPEFPDGRVRAPVHPHRCSWALVQTSRRGGRSLRSSPRMRRGSRSSATPPCRDCRRTPDR